MYTRPSTPAEVYKAMIAEERYKAKEAVKRAKFLDKLLKENAQRIEKLARIQSNGFCNVKTEA